MSKSQILSVQPPRFESRGASRIVGYEELLTADTRETIPQLWRRLNQSVGNIPGRLDRRGYGVIRNSEAESGFRYLAGFEVAAEAEVPEGMQAVDLAEQSYAVFSHSQHVSKLFATMCAIYRDWVPHADVALADEPCFELYGEDFDPETGLGTIEIWLPIEPGSKKA
jgi:AraC family transcriptional regulator